MTSKQRNVILQRWSGVIRRDARDFASLDQLCARALADSDVRDDAELQSMIRAEVQQQRAKLEQDLQSQRPSPTAPESQPDWRAAPPEPAPPATPEEDRKTFNRLAQALCASLERSDENETRAVLGKLRVLQEQRPELVPAALIAEYEQRVEELRAHLQQLTDQITTLVQRAVSASRDGDEHDLAQSMRRLTAIHVAHPPLLDEDRLDRIRADVARAADERWQNRSTTQLLLKREREIVAEIKKLAATVHEFHRVAGTVPETSEEFRMAEAAYLRAIRQARTYDTEWFSGVVLDLADLLAQWTVPPLGAEGQIDRFLDSISAGLDSIRAEMRRIKNKQDPDESNGGDLAAPES